MGDNFHTPLDDTATFKPASLNPPFSELDLAITYLKNVIVHCDGSITYDKSTGVLAWSDVLRITFNRANGDACENTVVAGNITLSDNEFAYVDLSETDGQAISVAKAAITTDAASNFIAYNRLVLAYRNAASDELYAVYLKNIWGSAGTATAFTDLSDTPSSYSGEGSKFVKVNSGETALEFVSGVAGNFTDHSDTPGSYSGEGGRLVKVNSGETALEFDKEREYQTLTPADSITIDWSLGSTAYCLLDRATTTFTFSNGRAGQRLTLIVEQDATGGRAVAFTSECRGGTDLTLPPTLSAATKTDYLGFVYNSTDSKYDFVAISKGY